MQNNPFLTKGYISPEYFCNREEETAKIIAAIENGRDLTLISLRKIGKTGLISHIINQEIIKSKYTIINCDILKAGSLGDMVQILGNETFNQLEKSTDRILKNIRHFLSGISPALTIDPITQQTNINFNIQNNEQAEITIQQIFSMMNKSKKPVLLIFDEFQQISDFLEKNVEATLRTHLQHMNNVRLIYSGSIKHILYAMFTEKNRPFYQSTQIMELDKIKKEVYAQFIQKKFAFGNMKVNYEAINFIQELTYNHTFYVQFLCNRLYEIGIPIITKEIVLQKLHEILLENESNYFNTRTLLTKQQFELIKAIAKEGGVKQPSSQKFINKYQLGTTSTINSAIKSLLKKGTIFQEKSVYQVEDVFFSQWLKFY